MVILLRIRNIMLMVPMDNFRIKKRRLDYMDFFANGKIVGRIGCLKFSDKFNLVSVAVNYTYKDQSKCNWFNVFDFEHFLDGLDESYKGKIISLSCYIRPSISKVNGVNVHNYILVLSKFDIVNLDNNIDDSSI